MFRLKVPPFHKDGSQMMTTDEVYSFANNFLDLLLPSSPCRPVHIYFINTNFNNLQPQSI